MNVTKEMVDRFLCWKLPSTFYPDGGISFSPPRDLNNWPTGTNVLTAIEAKAMLEHVLASTEGDRDIDIDDGC